MTNIPTLDEDSRSAELKDNLAEVRDRIDQAATVSGRSGADVALTIVTKTYPATDVYRLFQLGARNFAENRDQEAAPKSQAVAELIGGATPVAHDSGVGAASEATWHFVGQTQTNKTNSIVQYAAIVESVDRPKLARALAKSVAAQNRAQLTCLIQVNLDPTAPQGRGGAQPAELPELAQVITELAGLELGGLMAVAPLGADPSKAFENLESIRQNFLRDYPEAGMMSAGMSSDFELAIEFGATHVRLGAAVLGERTTLR